MHTSSRAIASCVAVFALAVSIPTHTRASEWSIRDLGSLGGPFSAAYGINDKGVVVGDSLIDREHTHAFLFRDGQMENIGTLGASWSRRPATSTAWNFRNV